MARLAEIHADCKSLKILKFRPIITAMTMLAPINKFRARATVTKLKKFYGLLSQNYLYGVQEYGGNISI